MSVAEYSRRAGFSLRLEQGSSGLVLTERRFADLLRVERLELHLQSLPARFDMSRGVERFRHQRARLERLVVSVDEQDVERLLRARVVAPAGSNDGASGTDRSRPVRGMIRDLELRASRDHVVIAGEIAAPIPVPFVARVRLEPAAVAGERTLVVSIFDIRLFGLCDYPATTIATELLHGAGLGSNLAGPTCAVIDPVDTLLVEIFADLGWKLPERKGARIQDLTVQGGSLRLVATDAEQHHARLREAPVADSAEGDAVYRRFLADYEAKTLYSSYERLIGAGEFERAIEAYERQLEVHPDHPFLITRLVQLLGGRRETRARAFELARRHLQRYADEPNALTALANGYRANGDVEGAARAYHRLAKLALSRGHRIEAAQCLCAVAATLGARHPAMGVDALEQALAIRKRPAGVLRALAELHGRTGNWAGALRARERLLAEAKAPADRRELLRELAHLALESVGDIETAKRYFERALQIEADDVDALSGLAKAHEAAGRLLPAVRALDRIAELQQARGDAAAAACTMVRLATLWLRLPTEGAATAALRFQQALSLDPTEADAVLGLAELADEAGDADQARRHFETLLRLPRRPRQAGYDVADIHLRLARLLAGPLEEPLSAVPHLQKALSGSPERAGAALEQLMAVYASSQRWDDLARVLELAIGRAEDVESRVALMCRLGDVLGGPLGDRRRAVAVLEGAARLATGDVRVLEALAVLLRSLEDAQQLVDVLARLIDAIEDPSKLAKLHTERAELLKRKLNRADEAAKDYALALGCVPDSRQALAGLADHYRERERLGELAPLLARWARAEGKGEEAARLWVELAQLQEGPLQIPGAAIASYEQALLVCADDVIALRGLADLRFAAGEAELALERYLRLYEVYEQTGYDERRGPFCLRLAEAFAAVDRSSDALGMLHEAAKYDPDELAVYERALDAYLSLGDIEGIVGFFTAGLDRARRPQTQLYLASRAGRLLWRELRRPADAMLQLDRAAELAPDDEELLRVRIEVASALADWARVESLLRAQLERAASASRPGILTRLANLAFGELDHPREGMRLILAALDEDPAYVPALILLGDQAYQAAEWEIARNAYGTLVDQAGPLSRPDDVYRLAIAELYSGEIVSAAERLEKLHRQATDLADVLPSLAEAYLQLGDSDGLSRVLAERLEGFEDHAGAWAGFLRRAGRALSTQTRHIPQGIECWRALLQAHPDDFEARQALAKLGVADSAGATEPSTVDLGSTSDSPDLDVDSLEETTRGLGPAEHTLSGIEGVDELVLLPDEADFGALDDLDVEITPMPLDAALDRPGEESFDEENQAPTPDTFEDPPKRTMADPAGVSLPELALPLWVASIEDPLFEPPTGQPETPATPELATPVGASQSALPERLPATRPVSSPEATVPPEPADQALHERAGTDSAAADEPISSEIDPSAATIGAVESPPVVALWPPPDQPPPAGPEAERPPDSAWGVVQPSTPTREPRVEPAGEDPKSTTDESPLDEFRRIAPTVRPEPGSAPHAEPQPDLLEGLGGRDVAIAADGSASVRAEQLEKSAQAAAATAEAADQWLQLAELRRDELLDVPGALAAYRAVLDVSDASEETWSEASEAVEELLSLEQDWDGVIELCEQRISRGSGSPSEARLLQASMHRAAGRLGKACDVAVSALEEGGEAARDLLVSLLEAAGRHDEAGNRLLENIESLEGSAAAHRRWRAADLLSQTQPDRSLELYAAAAAGVADSAMADSWLALARGKGHSAAIVGALEYRAGLLGTGDANAIRRSRLLVEAGETARARLGDAVKARALLEAALVARPENIEALERLGEVLSGLDDAEALEGVLNRQLEALVPGPSYTALSARIARLRAERLGDREGAISVLRRALERAQPHPVTERARGYLARLEGRQSSTRSVSGPSAHVRKPEDRSPVAERRKPAPAKPAVRVMRRSQRSGVRHGEAKAKGSNEPLARGDGTSLRNAALHRRALEVLERVYREERRGYELCDVIERHIGVATTGSERAGLRLDKAGIYADWLDEPAAAIRCLMQALEEPGASLETLMGSYRALLKLTSGSDEALALADLLDRRVEAARNAEDSAEHRAFLALRGELRRQRLDDAAGATRDLRLAVDCESPMPLAWLGLARLAAEMGDASEALVLGRQALEAAAPDGAALDLTEERAAFECMRRALAAAGRTHELSTIAEELLAKQPSCRPALDYLDESLEASGEWGPFLERMELALAAENEASVTAALLRRKAEILAQKLGHLDDARQAIEASLAADSDDRESRSLAMELAEQAGDWSAYVAHAEGLLSGARGRGPAPMGPSAARTPAARGAAALSRSVAMVYLERLDAPADALRVLAPLIATGTPSVMTVDLYTEAARVAQSWDDLATGLRITAALREASDGPCAPSVVGASVELAGVLAFSLDRVAESRQLLDGLVETLGAHGATPPDALTELLDRLRAETGDG